MTVRAETGVVLRQKLGDHVELVTLNRPEARNAVNAEVAAGLENAVRETEADADVWAVILTGAGDAAFCAGADLREVAEGRLATLYTPDFGFAGLVKASRTKPWIAAVEGAAVAGGLELVLACDMVIAGRSARFGLPEVSRRLLAAAGGVYRMSRLIPRNLALELIATGASMSAERAFELGLVNRLCSAGEAKKEALLLAAEICANAPLAVRESLAVARRAFDLDDAALMQLSAEAQERLKRTEDFAEGPRAFLERRRPTWMGR